MNATSRRATRHHVAARAPSDASAPRSPTAALYVCMLLSAPLPCKIVAHLHKRLNSRSAYALGLEGKADASAQLAARCMQAAPVAPACRTSMRMHLERHPLSRQRLLQKDRALVNSGVNSWCACAVSYPPPPHANPKPKTIRSLLDMPYGCPQKWMRWGDAPRAPEGAP